MTLVVEADAGTITVPDSVLVGSVSCNMALWWSSTTAGSSDSILYVVET